MTTNSPSPRISIILPTYNRAEYIVETIESIRNQTYPNWELLVIDDGSKDNTEALIREIKDERIQFHKTKKRLGIAGTRNEGLRIADGDLIGFMDSDDLWAPAKLEKQVAALEQYPDAGFSLTGGFNFKNSPDEPIDFFYKQKEGIKYDNIFIPIFRSEISATTPSLVFRKQCLDVTGFIDESSSFTTMDLILKLAKHFKAVILYEPLLYRRLHDSNISGAGWERGYNDGVAMIRYYKNNLPPKIVSNALFSLYMNFGEDCLLHKKRKKALINFFNGWKNKPASIVPLKKNREGDCTLF
ncbi:MAG: glycosyltransferase family A protein [Bacteroidota bacterium]